MLIILEGLCRDASYTWASDKTLAKRYGGGKDGAACSMSTVKDILASLEQKRIIYRKFTDSGRPGRVGIFLLQRLNADLPVDDDESIPNSIDRLAARRAAGKPAPERPESRPHRGAGNPATEEIQRRNQYATTTNHARDPEPSSSSSFRCASQTPEPPPADVCTDLRIATPRVVPTEASPTRLAPSPVPPPVCGGGGDPAPETGRAADRVTGSIAAPEPERCTDRAGDVIPDPAASVDAARIAELERVIDQAVARSGEPRAKAELKLRDWAVKFGLNAVEQIVGRSCSATIDRSYWGWIWSMLVMHRDGKLVDESPPRPKPRPAPRPIPTPPPRPIPAVDPSDVPAKGRAYEALGIRRPKPPA